MRDGLQAGWGGEGQGERAHLDVVAGAARPCSLVAQRLGPVCLLQRQVLRLRLLLLVGGRLPKPVACGRLRHLAGRRAVAVAIGHRRRWRRAALGAGLGRVGGGLRLHLRRRRLRLLLYEQLLDLLLVLPVQLHALLLVLLLQQIQLLGRTALRLRLLQLHLLLLLELHLLRMRLVLQMLNHELYLLLLPLLRMYLLGLQISHELSLLLLGLLVILRRSCGCCFCCGHSVVLRLRLLLRLLQVGVLLLQHLHRRCHLGPTQRAQHLRRHRALARARLVHRRRARLRRLDGRGARLVRRGEATRRRRLRPSHQRLTHARLATGSFQSELLLLQVSAA